MHIDENKYPIPLSEPLIVSIIPHIKYVLTSKLITDDVLPTSAIESFPAPPPKKNNYVSGIKQKLQNAGQYNRHNKNKNFACYRPTKHINAVFSTHKNTHIFKIFRIHVQSSFV